MASARLCDIDRWPEPGELRALVLRRKQVTVSPLQDIRGLVWGRLRLPAFWIPQDASASHRWFPRLTERCLQGQEVLTRHEAERMTVDGCSGVGLRKLVGGCAVLASRFPQIAIRPTMVIVYLVSESLVVERPWVLRRYRGTARCDRRDAIGTRLIYCRVRVIQKRGRSEERLSSQATSSIMKMCVWWLSGLARPGRRIDPQARQAPLRSASDLRRACMPTLIAMA